MDCNANQQLLGHEKCKRTPRETTPASFKSNDSGYHSFCPSSSPHGRRRTRTRSFAHLTDHKSNRSPHFDNSVLEENVFITAAATSKVVSRQRYCSLRYVPKLRLNEFVDFIQELQSFPHMIQLVLSYLSPRDLCAINCVTHGWNAICCSDPVANRRRLEFLKQESIHRAAVGKENLCAKSDRNSPSTSSNSTPLRESGNVLGDQPQLMSPVPVPQSRFQKFLEAGQSLPSDGRLTPCIHCTSPSQMSPGSSRASCMEPSCALVFCIRCWQQYEEPHKCVRSNTPPRKTKARISSKSSKKNLQRLAR